MAVAGFRSCVLAPFAAALAACTPVAPGPGAPLTELAGTSWRVVQINAQPTPAVGDYSMRFQSGGEASARFGCNSMGGRYRIAGDMLTISDVVQTLMGCAEPANTFESQGGAVLGQPMRMAFSSNDRMYLTNAGGSIALDPVR